MSIFNCKKNKNKIQSNDFYTTYKDFRTHVWDKLPRDDFKNKSIVIDKYLRNTDLINKKIYIKLLTLVSNTAMVSETFSYKLMRLNTLEYIFIRLEDSKRKMLFYSIAWNIYRFPICRYHLSLSFCSKITKDFHNILINHSKDETVLNTFFGCLSNISLTNDKCRKIILDFVFKDCNIKYLYILNEEQRKNIYAILANISYSEQFEDRILKNKFIDKLVSTIEVNSNTNDVLLIKNFLVLNNNLLNNENYKKFFVNNNILQIYRRLENSNIHTNRHYSIFFNYMKSFFNVNSFNQLENLHIAIEQDMLDYIYMVIKNDKTLINLKNENGYTPLQLSLIIKNEKLIKFFVMSGANVNINDDINPRESESVQKYLKYKNNAEKYIHDNIEQIFDDNTSDNYEKHIIPIVSSYIDIMDETYNILN